MNEYPSAGSERRWRWPTRAIHAGQPADERTGAVTPPLYLTSTFRQRGLRAPGPYEYARVQNPTREMCEHNLAILEGGQYACAFASGMAALTALAMTFQPGDHCLVALNVYGGTYRLFHRVLRDWGLDVEFFYPVHPEVLQARVRPERTRMILIETPSNPLLEIADIAAFAQLAEASGSWLVVDNTFMSPYLQRPLEHGAHIVVHSTTKYINGHSDSLGGVVILGARSPDPRTSVDSLHDRLRFVQKSTGGVLSPFEAWLILRGVKTLHVRMDRHCANAREVACFLRDHPAVERVYFPDFPDHPGADIHTRQAAGPGGVVTFAVRTGVDLDRFFRALRICTFGESLGGVETLISHPATMTHGTLPAEVRQRLGIHDRLVRISVGIEDVNDILDDLRQALAQASVSGR